MPHAPFGCYLSRKATILQTVKHAGSHLTLVFANEGGPIIAKRILILDAAQGFVPTNDRVVHIDVDGRARKVAYDTSYTWVSQGGAIVPSSFVVVQEIAPDAKIKYALSFL